MFVLVALRFSSTAEALDGRIRPVPATCTTITPFLPTEPPGPDARAGVENASRGDGLEPLAAGDRGRRVPADHVDHHVRVGVAHVDPQRAARQAGDGPGRDRRAVRVGQRDRTAETRPGTVHDQVAVALGRGHGDVDDRRAHAGGRDARDGGQLDGAAGAAAHDPDTGLARVVEPERPDGVQRLAHDRAGARVGRRVVADDVDRDLGDPRRVPQADQPLPPNAETASAVRVVPDGTVIVEDDGLALRPARRTARSSTSAAQSRSGPPSRLRWRARRRHRAPARPGAGRGPAGAVRR